MNRRLTRIALAAALTLTATIGFVSSAKATYHENLIREVHDGGGVNPDYVMLQAYSAGQNLVAGKHIVTYDGGGGPLTDYTIPSNVANGANQATILISSGATPGADFANVGSGPTGLNVVNTGGTVCFTDSDGVTGLDCVAYVGSFAATAFPPVPPASPYGTALSLGGQDLNDKSIVRTIARACPTLLEAADDTNSSAADFSVGNPIARGNSVTPTETACPPGNPTSPTNPAGKTRKRKCKKHKKKKKHHAASAKKHKHKKKCKKKKKKHKK
ncbi:MAG: hypothetical protein WBV53_05820 [Solirubrobacterales bacterium]